MSKEIKITLETYKQMTKNGTMTKELYVKILDGLLTNGDINHDEYNEYMEV
ncbi:MAG: hypothetical protein RSN61_21405 [Chryseobacterium sp.]|uniref:hypothetical protein n=1 Tax=Chryseobacterium sp. TaxID=1871047 RepID=UPI002FCA51DE